MINIERMSENSDGSLDIIVNMDQDSLILFAKIGMMKLLEDAAKRVNDGYLDAKGARDERAGEGSVDPLSGDFPGF